MTTIFEQLRLEHDQHRDYLKKIIATEGDSKARRELFDRFKKELEGHAAAEERVLYSAMLGDELTRDKGGHSVKEHHEINEMLEALSDADFSSPQWLKDFKKLAHEVEHHEDEEEHETFQLAGKLLSKEQKQSMAEEFVKEKIAEEDRLA